MSLPTHRAWTSTEFLAALEAALANTVVKETVPEEEL